MQVTNGQNRSYELATRCDAIAITLDENGSNAATYELDIYVLSDEGRNYLGTLNTVSVLNTPVAPARVIGYAVCPGARGWAIETTGTGPTLEGTPVKVTAELRAQPVDPAAFGFGPGIFRPLGRIIFNGNVGTAIGADSTAPLVSNRTDSTGPTAFLGAFGSNETASTIWIMFFDSATLPADGTQPVHGLSFNVPAGGSFNYQADPPGIFLANGLTWAASSTPNTLTHIAAGLTARVVTKQTF